MFSKMKNKLFLKTWPDTRPDSSSPRPPTDSQICSQCTHKNTWTRPTGTQCSQDRLKAFSPEKVKDFSYPKPGGVSPGSFSLQNRFFLLASGSCGGKGSSRQGGSWVSRAQSLQAPWCNSQEPPNAPSPSTTKCTRLKEGRGCRQPSLQRRQLSLWCLCKPKYKLHCVVFFYVCNIKDSHSQKCELFPIRKSSSSACFSFLTQFSLRV